MTTNCSSLLESYLIGMLLCPLFLLRLELLLILVKLLFEFLALGLSRRVGDGAAAAGRVGGLQGVGGELQDIVVICNG